MIENQHNTTPGNTRPATTTHPPIPLESCRGRRIINSDQVECLTPLSHGCEFMLSIGQTRICRHRQRLDIAARPS